MGNFFLDNEDIAFQLSQFDLRQLAVEQEDRSRNGDADYTPDSPEDAVDNYYKLLEIVGDIAANTLAPHAETIDAQGNTLNDDGTVTLHPLVEENLNRCRQANLMGFTLPRDFGGLNSPGLIYSVANEIISRADASFMNIFGLQGNAETINAFGSEELRQKYIRDFAISGATGAMALTEPDAGSDLQAVSLKAHQDESGQWYLNGVKRFITNGCGEILVTLARSEPDVADGRGLSVFVSRRCPQIRVRHLEEKLGIHGSPTCELVFTDAPAELIGERQRGLITYVMALMNGARLGIAAQSVGIAEAAYRLARTYAASRCQFGMPIERLPAVAELVVGMKLTLEAGRTLMYQTAYVCDQETNNLRILEGGLCADKAEEKVRKSQSRTLKRVAGMLTPMSKYYCSEMANRVASDAIQVLGGSGYIKDYAAERFFRDARITTIYEGTSQLQVLAAIRSVSSGIFAGYIADFETKEYDDELLDGLKAKLVQLRERTVEAVNFAKSQAAGYLDLSGRRVVDAAIHVVIGHLLLSQGVASQRKRTAARVFIESGMPGVLAGLERVLSGDAAFVEEYALLAGPVPEAE